jgi:hypothetical protein
LAENDTALEMFETLVFEKLYSLKLRNRRVVRGKRFDLLLPHHKLLTIIGEICHPNPLFAGS